MGTSASSSGPGKFPSFDPAWLLPDENPLPNENQPEENPQADEEQSPITEQVENLWGNSSRFGTTRTSLGQSRNSGDSEAIKRALGRYVKTGNKGSANLVRRMQASTRVGSQIVGFFNVIARNETANLPTNLRQLAARLSSSNSRDEWTRQIINTFVPGGGSLEEESCRDSIANAMSECYERFPDLIISEYGEDQSWYFLEKYCSSEIFAIFCRDNGEYIDKRFVGNEWIEIRNTVKEYIESCMSVQVEETRKRASTGNLVTTMDNILKKTFDIFVGEVE